MPSAGGVSQCQWCGVARSSGVTQRLPKDARLDRLVQLHGAVVPLLRHVHGVVAVGMEVVVWSLVRSHDAEPRAGGCVIDVQ